MRDHDLVIRGATVIDGEERSGDTGQPTEEGLFVGDTELDY
jgi:hypothetical protein